MNRWRPFLETVHIAALALWLGAIVGAGAAAATLFPTLKDLGISIPDYDAYTGPHWSLAAGVAAERVFFITDLIQFPCALLAALTLVGLFAGGIDRTRLATILRCLALVLGIACLGAMLLVVTPSLNTSSAAYRQAAQAGDMPLADEHKRAFDDLHPLATNLMGGGALSVLLCLLCSAWSASTPPQPRPPSRSMPVLEEPALLRRPG